MKEKFLRFMYGRNGMDAYNRFLFITAIILYLLSGATGSGLLYWISVAILLYSYYRIFSKNLYKRAEENRTYLNKTANIRYKARNKWAQLKQMRTHHIYKCPTCKQKIRIPRGKGRIEIRCPRCKSTFIKNS